MKSLKMKWRRMKMRGSWKMNKKIISIKEVLCFTDYGVLLLRSFESIRDPRMGVVLLVQIIISNKFDATDRFLLFFDAKEDRLLLLSVTPRIYSTRRTGCCCYCCCCCYWSIRFSCCCYWSGTILPLLLLLSALLIDCSGINRSVSPLLVLKNSLMLIRERTDFIDVVVKDFTIENPGQSLQKHCVFC